MACTTGVPELSANAERPPERECSLRQVPIEAKEPSHTSVTANKLHLGRDHDLGLAALFY